MSVDCNFEVADALIYSGSWNLRNNWALWRGCSIELNALNKENWLDAHSVSLATKWFRLSCQSGVEGSTIPQDPPNGWRLIRASLGSWEHRHHSSCSCPRKISTTTESFILQDKWHRKWILQAIFQVFLIAIMMIFITLLGIVASVNAIRAINQDLTTAKTEARQSNEHKIP